MGPSTPSPPRRCRSTSTAWGGRSSRRGSRSSAAGRRLLRAAHACAERFGPQGIPSPWDVPHADRPVGASAFRPCRSPRTPSCAAPTFALAAALSGAQTMARLPTYDEGRTRSRSAKAQPHRACARLQDLRGGVGGGRHRSTRWPGSYYVGGAHQRDGGPRSPREAGPAVERNGRHRGTPPIASRPRPGRPRVARQAYRFEQGRWPAGRGPQGGRELSTVAEGGGPRPIPKWRCYAFRSSRPPRKRRWPSSRPPVRRRERDRPGPRGAALQPPVRRGPGQPKNLMPRDRGGRERRTPRWARSTEPMKDVFRPSTRSPFNGGARTVFRGRG